MQQNLADVLDQMKTFKGGTLLL
jgi:hypothetical protein